jgi:hypothetical protein
MKKILRSIDTYVVLSFIFCLVVFLSIVASKDLTLNNTPLEPKNQLAQVSSSLDNGLVAKWSFDEGSGTTASDSVGGNTGTLTNGPSWAAGKVGSGAIQFDGVDDHVSLSVAKATGTSGTFCAWVNPSTNSVQQAILTSAGITDTTHELRFSLNSVSGSLYPIILSNNGGSADWVRTTNSVPTNSWSYVCVTGNGTTYQLFINGVKETIVIGNGSNTGKWFSAISGIANYKIGLLTRSAGNVIPFSGKIDELRVYDRVLSDAEIQELSVYTGGVGNPPVNPTPTPTQVTQPDNTTDTIPPVISITNPVSGTVSGTVSVNVSVTDNVAVSGVQFKLDGNNFGSEVITSPYSISLNTTTLSNGVHTLTAIARDSSNLTTTSATISITVSNEVVSTGPKTWNVSKGGGDFPNATYPIQACANVAKAGDTCLVQAGEYDDYVTTKAGGVSGNYLTFQASGRVVMNGFWVKHPYVKITGFDITQGNIQKVIAQAPYETRSVHIDAGANNCIFSNNTIKNGPFVNLKNAYFNSSDKTISFTDNLNDKYVNGGFLKAGIKPGDPLTIQAFEAKPISNQSQKRVYVSRAEGSVTDRVLRLSDTSPITQEGPVNVFITAFNTSDVAFNAIYMEGNNCQISDNVFENLNAFGIIFSGSQNTISRNKFSLMAGGDIFQVWGHDHLIQYNYITNSTPEIVPGAHQDFFQTYATGGPNAYNITFDHNFIENFDGALAQMNSVRPVGGVYSVIPGFHDIYFTNNVFYNITGKASVDILNTKFINNTFYNVGSETRAAIIFSSYVAGDNGGDADGSVVKNNAFVAIGNSRGGGWYSYDANTQLSQADYNYVAGAPDIGYQSKTGFTEAHGVNGGDPSFFNASNPVGVDGVPFTADDGFAPLLGSSLCDSGEGGTYIGAYRCLVPNGAYLLPRFTSLPSTNGYAPLTVNFDASGSRASGNISFYSQL